MLEERKIPREVIAQIASLDITTTSQFARTGRNDDDFAQWLEEDVQAKKSDPGGRSLHARLFDAFDLSTVILAKAKAGGQPTELFRGDHSELKRSYLTLVGPIRDELCPSHAYMNRRIQELEDN